MDTTRRQLLAAIPVVGIAAAVGQGQDAPAQRESWEYEPVITGLTAFDKQGYWDWLNKKGRDGWSIAYLTVVGDIEDRRDVRMVLKRPFVKKEEDRVAWEMKWFDFEDTHTLGQDWQLCAFLPRRGQSAKHVAQRPILLVADK